MAGHFRPKRIHKIMKSSVEVEHISKESIILVTRAAELFVDLLLKEANKDLKKAKKLQYRNIAKVVNDHERYEFLSEMIPHKIKVREYYEIMKKKFGNDVDLNEKNDGRSSSSSSSSSDDSSSDSEEAIEKPSESDVDVMVVK